LTAGTATAFPGCLTLDELSKLRASSEVKRGQEL